VGEEHFMTANRTNEEVWTVLCDHPSTHVTTARKLQYFGHVIHNDRYSVKGTIMRSLVPETERDDDDWLWQGSLHELV